jgi:hypothetical protein
VTDVMAHRAPYGEWKPSRANVIPNPGEWVPSEQIFNRALTSGAVVDLARRRK